ncbi:MAG: type II toxin-antitoxin system VapB family antitoxin [Geminicoccaceae bacterium]
MRVTIEVDEALMAEVLQATGIRTESEVVDVALRLLVRRAQQSSARDLFGTVEWQGDLDTERRDLPRRGPTGTG